MFPKKGFSLIGLLVVIAIIAILAALLFPVYATVKESTSAAGAAFLVCSLAIAGSAPDSWTRILELQTLGRCVYVGGVALCLASMALRVMRRSKG